MVCILSLGDGMEKTTCQIVHCQEKMYDWRFNTNICQSKYIEGFSHSNWTESVIIREYKRQYLYFSDKLQRIKWVFN